MSPQVLLEVGIISVIFIISISVLWQVRHQKLTASEKAEKFLTALLGTFLTIAGSVKFFEPFNTMFTKQIAYSELPFQFLSRWAGQLGEIGAGLLFLVALFAAKTLGKELTKLVVMAASALTTIIMVVAIYVHLMPQVPAEVLPLQSKPPILTLVILGIMAMNVMLLSKNNR